MFTLTHCHLKMAMNVLSSLDTYSATLIFIWSLPSCHLKQLLFEFMEFFSFWKQLPVVCRNFATQERSAWTTAEKLSAVKSKDWAEKYEMILSSVAVKIDQCNFKENLPVTLNEWTAGEVSGLMSTCGCGCCKGFRFLTWTVSAEITLVKVAYCSLTLIGLPKAAVVTHERVWAASFIQAVCGVTADDIFYINLPLYHSAGFLIGMAGAIERGKDPVSAHKHYNKIIYCTRLLLVLAPALSMVLLPLFFFTVSSNVISTFLNYIMDFKKILFSAPKYRL